MIAARHGHTNLVKELVKAGTNLDLQNRVQLIIDNMHLEFNM